MGVILVLPLSWVLFFCGSVGVSSCLALQGEAVLLFVNDAFLFIILLFFDSLT